MATLAPAKTAAAPAVPRVPQPRPYRDFLTPALHRRFTSAALIGLAICWVEAIVMSEPGLLWSWFPLGPAGIRTLLLFISSLSIFILRVAQLHFGPRTTTSSLETFWQSALSRNTVQTLFWYSVSAFLFSEVYIFSTAASANLAWIDPGRSYERPRLNERPVLLRTLFVILAVAQSALHLYRDYDLVLIGPTAGEKSPAVGKSEGARRSPLAQLQAVAGLVAQRSVSLVLSTAIAGPFIYFIFLRSIAWTIALKIGRSLFTLSKQVKPSGLTDVTALMFRFAWSALLLTIIWEVSNQAFTIYTAQEPLKKGQPLTADSKDPNGSLIAGLKAKKDIPKNIAFWELNIISARFAERRVTLYGDMDRRGGSTWSQISNACLAEIQAVSQRIQDCHKPADQPTSPQKSPQTAALPKISRPIKHDNIFGASPPATSGMEIVQNTVGAMARHYGSSPSPGPSPVGVRAQKLLEYGSNNLLGEDKRQQLTRSNLTSQANGYLGALLRSPIGVPFRRSFDRQVNAVVFGVPFSGASRIINAVESICNLVVHSLKEDRLGQVQKDIAMIVRTLTVTIQDVQKFVHTLPPHWTDVEFNGNRQVREVEELLAIMRGGLEQILLAFGEYADQLGLTKSEVRTAKQLAVGGPEMEMTRRK